jgi:hypothetical protein
VTNYTNVFIPTNLEVAESVKENFGSFYAALFDATLEKNKDADGRNPVITEYSWMAGSCDPCPGPALQPQDALILGGDVLPSFAEDVKNQNIWSLTRSLTLTRLHARYDQTSLGEDLVFRAGTPKEGGRETGRGDTKNYTDARDYSYNNFQGRYIIRHFWEGEIKCQDPIRGRWGGPVGNPFGRGAPTAARDLAFVKRGGISLPSVLVNDLPELGIKASQKKINPSDKKKYEPSNGASPTLPSITPMTTPTENPISWGFIVAAIGGLILLMLVVVSRPKNH